MIMIIIIIIIIITTTIIILLIIIIIIITTIIIIILNYSLKLLQIQFFTCLKTILSVFILICLIYWKWTFA